MYFQGRYSSILDHAFGSNSCVFVLCHRPSQMLCSCPHSYLQWPITVFTPHTLFTLIGEIRICIFEQVTNNLKVI